MNLFEHPFNEFAASLYEGLQQIGLNRKYKFLLVEKTRDHVIDIVSQFWCFDIRS